MELELRAVYLNASISVEVKNFDRLASIHGVAQRILEGKLFHYNGVNVWTRRIFKNKDDYDFWVHEVKELVSKPTLLKATTLDIEQAIASRSIDKSAANKDIFPVKKNSLGY